MVSAEEKAAKIVDECGFIKNFLLEMDINDEIRELEEFARTQRPPTALKTEPLTRFLPSEQAKRLEELRREKLRLKDVEERGIVCIKNRFTKEGIKLVKTKKGTFAIGIEKPKKEEEKEGLAALFG